MMADRDGRARAHELISGLGLEVLDGESGWWRQLRESAIDVTLVDGRRLPASNTIHFVLSPDRPVNIWHLLESDDAHVLVEGGPVEYVLLPPAGQARAEVLGGDLGAGQSPVIVIPAGVWTALRLVDPGGSAWIVSTVTPAWTPDRARIGLDPETRRRWVAAEPWLTPELLDDLDDPEPR
jgi:predicted cupin superfamily sugar epimerase